MGQATGEQIILAKGVGPLEASGSFGGSWRGRWISGYSLPGGSGSRVSRSWGTKPPGLQEHQHPEKCQKGCGRMAVSSFTKCIWHQSKPMQIQQTRNFRRCVFPFIRRSSSASPRNRMCRIACSPSIIFGRSIGYISEKAVPWN